MCCFLTQNDSKVIFYAPPPNNDYTVITMKEPPSAATDHKADSPELPLAVVQRSHEAQAAAFGTSARRKTHQTLGALLLLLLGGVLGRRSAQPPRTLVDAAQAPTAPDRVLGLGLIEPLSGLRTLAPPFGAGDARIAELKVHEGQHVEAGELLAVFDNERALQAAVATARAQVRSRDAARGQVLSAVTASRGEVRAQLERARVAASAAQQEFERADGLFQRGGATSQLLDQQRALRDEAQRDVERLAATLSRYGTGSVNAQTDAILAGRNVDAAEAELARAMTDLDKAYLRAPTAGTVLSIFADPGERPSARGVMTMGDLSRMSVKAEVYEAHVARLALGDAATIRAPGLREPLRGVVSNIGLEVGKQSTIDPSPAANTDARVVKVTLALDAPSALTARAWSNMQVTASISVHGAP